MSDQPKLTMDDVLRLRDEANRTPMGQAEAARKALVESVKSGEGAFADEAAFAYATWIVETFFS